ncbi:kinase-like domain-containing protein [Gigaspora rosea]|uniref:Kinase-like domain-containing protein n=1 Tax=Gigaspora rosea TaxID=44941 RepID=A0A397W407_9GLOM|nr:kinase-like domain-containing protein [Gigaspora rosea]
MDESENYGMYTEVDNNYLIIDKIIEECKIDIHYLNEFTNYEKIGEGGYGWVEKAEWKTRESTVALKSLKVKKSSNEILARKFAREVQLLAKITKNSHSNINQFYGVAKDLDRQIYYLILQYANDGNLREYLEKNFTKLTWDDKLNKSLNLATGLEYLHKNKIIHRDLHSKNILVHNGTVLIADFGISKLADGKSMNTSSTGHGIPAYVDPQYLKDNRYERDEKSDIYSLGVLFWEISSGLPPFKYLTDIPQIIYQIFQGRRELPVVGSPESYVQLYIRCWDEEPDNRPDIQEVVEALQLISKELSNEPIQLFATEVSQSVHATPFLSKTYNYHKAKSLNKQLDFQNLSKLDTFGKRKFLIFFLRLFLPNATSYILLHGPTNR